MDVIEAAKTLIKQGVLRVDPDGTIWRCRERTNTGKVKDVTPRRTELRAKCGYLIVNIRLNGEAGLVYAHRLVWEVLRGPIPSGMDINHLDGDKHNNNPSNLEVASRSENLRHAYRKGLKTIPWSVGPGTKETANSLRKRGLKLKEIAAELGISLTTAHRLCKAS